MKFPLVVDHADIHCYRVASVRKLALDMAPSFALLYCGWDLGCSTSERVLHVVILRGTATVSVLSLLDRPANPARFRQSKRPRVCKLQSLHENSVPVEGDYTKDGPRVCEFPPLVRNVSSFHASYITSNLRPRARSHSLYFCRRLAPASATYADVETA
jgi:hypothetical protein